MKVLTDTHLAFSVLISLGQSSGSGFLYQTEKKVYLITAKHVLYDDQLNFRNNEIEILCQSTDSGFSSHRFKIKLDTAQTAYHKTSDVALVCLGIVTMKKNDIGTTKFNCAPGSEILIKGERNPIIASLSTVHKFEEVMISNDVYVFGYPTSLGIQESIQFDLNKPLLRKGIVANVFESAKTIILDCPVYAGNSGGPVIQIIDNDEYREFKLIGVISQFIPFVQRWKNERDRIVHLEYLNSGYSVASSMDYVLELIDEIES